MSGEVPEMAEGRIQSRVASLVGSLRFWGLLVGVIASYPVLHVFMHPLNEVIPILDEAPGFRLTDSMGASVGMWDDTAERAEVDAFCVEAATAALKVGPAGCKNRGLPEDVVATCRDCDERVASFKADLNLSGYLWLAAPVCVQGSCSGVDGDLPSHLFEVQHRARGLGKYFQIIGFPVDGQEVGADEVGNYARDNRVSRTMWKFALGAPDRVRAALDGIFALPIPGTDDVGVEMEKMKYGVVALVDPGTYVRGYYDIRTEAGRDVLLRDMGLVGNRGY